MTWNNKVVWSEGMFLRPQCFQQQDRYFEHLVRRRTSGLRPFDWGFRDLQLDTSLLEAGKIGITSASGILADGTPFDIPNDADAPEPIDLDQSVRDREILLVLPLVTAGSAEVDITGDRDAARFVPRGAQIRDCNTGLEGISDVDLARPKFRLLQATEETGGYSCLGIARVIEVLSGGEVKLDSDYVPPALTVRTHPKLTGILQELQGLMGQRAEALSARISGSRKGEASEIQDFLMLQAINRRHLVIQHMMALSDLHPEQLFVFLLDFAGELATFSADGRHMGEAPVYRQEDLNGTFNPVMTEIRRALSAVMEQTAISLPIEKRRYGISVAAIGDRGLLNSCTFVLAAKGDMPNKDMQKKLPQNIKIGTVENIRDLVNRALPGIDIESLPVAPREVPHYSDYSYFELNRHAELWASLNDSGGFAFYLPKEFADKTEMALWAIRK